ncbi:hypothetical protein MUK42_32726 [Musa troglodytarum]|uniref:Uncharacterized protein n=1 Tax=Musa troglodytarum TaxID=320322 RepID=A0A9E7FCR2_9LILI|nr:hypothetical protein MUK42_32726 [Musa troglodytarum]
MWIEGPKEVKLMTSSSTGRDQLLRNHYASQSRVPNTNNCLFTDTRRCLRIDRKGFHVRRNMSLQVQKNQKPFVSRKDGAFQLDKKRTTMFPNLMFCKFNLCLLALEVAGSVHPHKRPGLILEDQNLETEVFSTPFMPSMVSFAIVKVKGQPRHFRHARAEMALTFGGAVGMT